MREKTIEGIADLFSQKVVLPDDRRARGAREPVSKRRKFALITPGDD